MITRPDMPIDNRTRQEWASRYAVVLVDWFARSHPPHGDFETFEDEQWNLQVTLEGHIAREAAA